MIVGIRLQMNHARADCQQSDTAVKLHNE